MTTRPRSNPVPASSFGWLDHREEDAERIREVLAAFSEKGTLDSIGVGTVRDALADLMFPGMSTIQTRARYFLFVPWIYKGLEDERVPAQQAKTTGRNQEVALIHALRRGSGDDRQGIIGVNARERIKILPRDIYWSGLHRFGILRCPGSSAQYLASLDQFYRRHRGAPRADDGEPVIGALPRNWDAGLPAAPPNLLVEASFALEANEAAYLRERVLVSAEGTLLAVLVRRAEPLRQIENVWELPFLAELDPVLRDQIVHAHRFALVMHGAQILYNLLLAQRTADDGAGSTELVEEIRDIGAAWVEEIDAHAADLGTWDLTRFWSIVTRQNPRIPVQTRRFVGGWVDRTLLDPEGALDDPSAHQNVIDRESQLKGPLARLSNRRAREVTHGTIGLDRLTYRWPNVRRIVTDLAQGLPAG
jgi:hypothetical protein